MIFDTSFGIDFRQNHLILALLRRSFGKIRLVDYRIHSLGPGTQKEERESQLIGQINAFISKNEVNKEKTSISIPREKAVVRFIRLPIATKENLRKVLEYETPKYSPFEKEEVYFDYSIVNEEKDGLNLFVVFVKKTEIAHYLALLKRVRIQPISVQIPTTAALNLFFYHDRPDKEEVSVLLDAAKPFFEVNLIDRKNFSESIYLPVNSEEESKVIRDVKRLVLKGDGLSKPCFYIHGLEADERMVGSFQASDQTDRFFFPPLNRIETKKEAWKPGVTRPYNLYASIGLPLKGLTQTRFDLNLLPPEMRKKVRQIGKPLVILLTALAILLSLTWGAGVFFRYRRELDAVNAEIKKRRPEVEAVEKIQKQRDGLYHEISELDKVRLWEMGKIGILEELTRILPETVWIWNLKCGEKEIEISGFADSASDLIPLLDRSPLFERVEFLAPVTKERMLRATESKEKERFRIKMRLEGRK
jgi:general secretion pathway protein L